MGNMVFGSRVKQLRRGSQLTMDEFAKKLGVTKSRVNMWENKGVVPRHDMLSKIANYFSVSIDYLLGHEATDDGWAEDPKREYLQRGLKQMDSKDLAKAEILLKAMFEDIFNDDEEHNGI